MQTSYRIIEVDANYGHGVCSIFYKLKGKVYLIQKRYSGFWRILGWISCRMKNHPYLYATFYSKSEAEDYIKDEKNI